MSAEARHGWSFLRTRRWIGYFALLIVFSIACVWLGNWQFDRRAEARAEIARIDANYDSAPLPLCEVIADPSSFDENGLKWQPVQLRGRYLDEVYLARNRPGPEGVGSNLIQAFRDEHGRVLFIDRGWVPVSGLEAAPPRLPTAPRGEVGVVARLRASEPAIQGRSSVGRTVGSIDLPELARLTGTSDTAITGAYGQLVAETPPGETGALAARPERDEGPHLSYALQWYVFILIAVIGLAHAARQEYRTLNAADESVRREDTRRIERRRRRGPSDDEEEDALLGG